MGEGEGGCEGGERSGVSVSGEAVERKDAKIALDGRGEISWATGEDGGELMELTAMRIASPRPDEHAFHASTLALPALLHLARIIEVLSERGFHASSETDEVEVVIYDCLVDKVLDLLERMWGGDVKGLDLWW